MPRIELMSSGHCPACAALRAELQALLAERGLSWRERDLVEALDDAVAAGVTQPPAVVVDGRVLAQGPAALGSLRKQLQNVLAP